jgi:hypothetical protein
MMRTVCFAIGIVLAAAGFTTAQDKPAAKPREELRYDGKPFAYWETFMRTELKAERRIDALRALAAFGARGYASEATAAIVEMLKDYEHNVEAFQPSEEDKGTSDQRVIREAILALYKVGPATSDIILAKLDQKAVRRVAAHILQPNVIPLNESSIPILVDWIASNDREASTVAVSILAGRLTFEPDDEAKRKRFRGALAKVVKEKNVEKAIVESLIDQLEKRIESYSAIAVMGALGPRAKAAVPTLVRADVQGLDASDALKEIGVTPAERLPGLVAELKGDRYQENAANKLADLGADARPAMADLLAEIKKPLPVAQSESDGIAVVRARMAIIAAYAGIAGSKEALPVVVELIDKNQNPSLASELVQVFLRHEKNPERIVPVLIQSLERNSANKKDEPFRWAVYQNYRMTVLFKKDLVDALGQQGEKAGSAVPILIKTFDNSNADRKLDIVRTLGKIGPAAKDALPMLSKLLQAPEEGLRTAAAEAIQAITKR